jgi:hypothetical protein
MEPRQRKQNSRFNFKALFAITSNAFRTQEWCYLGRDDVLRMRRTPHIVGSWKKEQQK